MDYDILKRTPSFPKLDEFYKTEGVLGIGAYSKVKLAIETSSGKSFALKIIDSIYFSSKGKNKYLKREKDALERISHFNVIKYISSFTFSLENDLGCLEYHDCLLLEYAENGSLFDYIFYEKKGLSEKIAKYIFQQIVNAVEACHNVGIAHGDLKSENILFHGDWTVKLCDFGNSYAIGSKNIDVKEGVTRCYCAPEILEGFETDILGVKSDVFSLGVILFILATGNFPFLETTNNDFFYRKIKSKKLFGLWDMYRDKLQIPECLTLTNDFKELFLSLVQYDQNDRPTLDIVKKSKWLSENIAMSSEVVHELERRRKFIRKCQSF